MLDNSKPTHQICTILDLPGDDPKAVAEFFCDTINHGNFRNLRFSFDTLGSAPRVILNGDPKDVISMIQSYYAR